MRKGLENEYSLYETADLALAAVIALQIPVEKVDKTNPRKVKFAFTQKSYLKELVDQFWRGEIEVEPKRYFNILRELKTRIHQREE